MIRIISICDDIAYILSSQLWVKDYRIALRGNEALYVYLIPKDQTPENEIVEFVSAIESIYENIRIEELEEEDLEDSFYRDLFKTNKKIILDYGKKRFTYGQNSDKIPHKSKIITFYSYKGGMGRSTTLAACALYLAIHHNKKVFIIDCDMEAPGFTNYFLKVPQENNQRNGLIEYIFDKKSRLIKSSDIVKYTREVDKTICNNGEIRIMHSGNLNYGKDELNKEVIDLNHYIQGLSRLDLQTTGYSANLLGNVIKDIEEQYNPDVILLDSRTGINDVFGLAISHLSDFVVGFFRNDVQTLPGLAYFIQETHSYNKLTNIFIVHSILPPGKQSKERMLKNFKATVDEMISEINNEDVYIEVFPLQRKEELEAVGTNDEDINEFYDLIKEKEFKDYNKLFETIADKLKDIPDNLRFGDTYSQKTLNINEDIQNFGNIEKLLQKPFNADELNRLSEQEREELVNEIRHGILKIFSRNLGSIDLYAENINNVLTDFKEHKFFLRNCMKDLFNLDKYIILGSKGTGKSYLYRALKEQEIVEVIQKFSAKDGKFYFLEAINKQNLILTIDKIQNDDITEEDKYRFWIIYTWQVLLRWIETTFLKFFDKTEAKRLYLHVDRNLMFQDFGDNTRTVEWLIAKLPDNNYVKETENQYEKLDEYLKKFHPDTRITILYDQLDEMISPELWDKWIPSLIRVWRFKRYSHIFGKLFLRRDLFNKLVGLTNKNDIRNQAIDIEWSKEEIYSYIIQIIFRPQFFNALWRIMYLYDKSNLTIIKQIKKYKERINEPTLEDYYLRHQIETLFGKYVRSKSFDFNQETYEWFFNNLKNADNTISVRPFVSLLKYALKNWEDAKYREEEGLYPILYQRYYFEPDVRKSAVEEYFTDLIENETGNLPIKYVFEFLEESKLKSYKKISIERKVFYRILEEVIDKNKDKRGMDEMTVEKLAMLLKTTGIVRQENYGRGPVYKFSFLYKYTLGLKGS